MSIKFDVAGPMNFSGTSYVIAFNTTGPNPVPNTDVVSNGYAGYSYEIVVSGNSSGAYANAYELFRQSGNSGGTPQRQNILVGGSLFQFQANSNGSNTEFTVTFSRSIFSGIVTPGGAPPPPLAGVWAFNAFTGLPNASQTFIYVDSLGAGGPGDPQWVSIPPLDVTKQFDTLYPGLYPTPISYNPGAQIVSVEIANNP